MTAIKTCPGCGAPRILGASYCQYCGKQFHQSIDSLRDERTRWLEETDAALDAAGFHRWDAPSYGSGGRVGLAAWRNVPFGPDRQGRLNDAEEALIGVLGDLIDDAKIDGDMSHTNSEDVWWWVEGSRRRQG